MSSIIINMPQLDKICELLQQISTRHHETTELSSSVEWMTTEDTMHVLHVSKKTLYNMRASGQLNFSKVNKKIYYRREDVNELLRSNMSNELNAGYNGNR